MKKGTAVGPVRRTRAYARVAQEPTAAPRPGTLSGRRMTRKDERGQTDDHVGRDRAAPTRRRRDRHRDRRRVGAFTPHGFAPHSRRPVPRQPTQRQPITGRRQQASTRWHRTRWHRTQPRNLTGQPRRRPAIGRCRSRHGHGARGHRRRDVRRRQAPFRTPAPRRAALPPCPRSCSRTVPAHSPGSDGPWRASASLRRRDRAHAPGATDPGRPPRP